jgi:hypothetical protein
MIEQGEVSVEHCPTKEMWADVLTKPLQGYQFYLMRSKLMGCPVYLSEEESLDGAADGNDATTMSPMHDGEGAKSKNNNAADGSVNGSDVPNGQVVKGHRRPLRDTTNASAKDSVTHRRSIASPRGCVGRTTSSGHKGMRSDAQHNLGEQPLGEDPRRPPRRMAFEPNTAVMMAIIAG